MTTTLLTTSPDTGITGSKQSLIESSVSENTRKAYGSVLRQLQGWLDGRTLTDSLLSDYLSERFSEGLSSSSCSLIVSAVKFQVKLHGIDPSPFGPITDRTLTGIRRTSAREKRGRGQVTGIGWERTDLLLSETDRDSTKGLRDALIFSLLSDCLLRVSELVGIQVRDLKQEEDGTGRLTIHTSKTDQEGQGSILFVTKTTMGFFRLWVKHSGIESGALFRSVNKGGRVGTNPLTAIAVRKLIKTTTKPLSRNGGRYSGHSFRVGSAQSLVRNGASLGETMQAGRWSSSRMVAHYSKAELAGRGAVARLRG